MLVVPAQRLRDNPGSLLIARVPDGDVRSVILGALQKSQLPEVELVSWLQDCTI